MAGSIFNEKAVEPNEQMLKTALKEYYSSYEKIKQHSEEHFGKITREWKYYGKKNGWLLKHLIGSKNILFVNPQAGYFKTTFTFGENAVKEILQSDIDPKIKKELSMAKKYAEGRVIQVSVESNEDVEDILKLINFKISS